MIWICMCICVYVFVYIYIIQYVYQFLSSGHPSLCAPQPLFTPASVHPSLCMQFLYTDLHVFLMVLMGRIGLESKSFFRQQLFSLLSRLKVGFSGVTVRITLILALWFVKRNSLKQEITTCINITHLF